MKKSVFCESIRSNLFKLLIQPVSYIAGAVFVFSVNFAFFQLGGFFTIDTASVDVRRLFSIIPYVSSLVIPALVIAVKNGKNDSYNFMPVSSAVSVSAKIIASFSFFSALLLLTLPSVLILSGFGDLTFPKVVSGYLCILLYGASICSFCCFIQECFSNRTASFFVSTIIIFLMSVCHLLPQYVKLPAFFSSLLTAVSVAWHTDAAGKGIIDTKDIVFFCTLTVVFLWLAIIKKESSKKKRVFLQPFIVTCAGILTIAVSSLFYIRLDITNDKQFSMSETGREIVEKTEAPLSITYYLSPELESLYPQVRDVKDYLNTLASENKNISVLTVNPAELESTARLENLGILSQQLQTTEDNKTSYISVYSSILLEYGNNAASIPFLLSTASLEYDLLMRIRAITTGFTNTVLLYVGNGLDVDTVYPYVKTWFQSSGFMCVDVSAQDLYDYKTTDKTVLLVIGSSEAQSSDAAAIENWTMRGGSTFFAVSPNVTDITGSWAASCSENDTIIEMLDFWGIGTDSGICVDETSCYRIRMYSSSGSDAMYIDYPYWLNTTFTGNGFTKTLVTQPVIMYWASPLYFVQKQNLAINPLIETSDGAWLTYPDNTDGEYITDPFFVRYLEPDKKSKGKYVLAASVEGSVTGCYDNKKSPDVRIIVAGDQYFPSVIMENTNSLYQNLDFMLSSMLWLSRDDNLISIKSKGNVNTTPYKISSQEEFSSKTTMIKAVCFVIIPVLILISYILVDFVRRRKASSNRKRIVDEETRR